ncbi:hypothetical protein BYT27DRAFT_7207944 [Phlegmacium glaucopus]|nr:hypothetical protein BYT27DRAFT_7207944 [Phlegmacium glaucopus]
MKKTSCCRRRRLRIRGGNKIAFDPRDIQQDANEEAKTSGKMPRLTLMEEVLLLGIKDKQGYLSFWNDNISYTLRGCILIKLALRRRILIALVRWRIPIAERIIEVIDDRQTGETILDETLKMTKMQQRADVRTKESIVSRVVTFLTSSTAALPPAALDKEGIQCRVLRDNAFGKLAYEDREAAFQRCDEILGEFICWPFGTGGINSGAPSVPATAAGRWRYATRIASGGGLEVSGRQVVLGLLQEVRGATVGGEDDVGFEFIAGVLEVLSKLDSL